MKRRSEPMTKEQLRQEWQAKTAEYEASGKRQSVWCRENGIKLRNFNRWYNKLKRQSASTPAVQGWVPVKITNESVNPSLNLRIGKVNIEIKEGFQPSLLAEVVKALGEIC